MGELRQRLGELEDGDILLCCSSHSYGEYARVLAKSKFDHVAVVVRHRPRLRPQDRRDHAKEFEQWPKLQSYHKVSQPDRDRDYDASAPTGDPLDDLELLESTGDGVHVYNLVSRLRDDTTIAERYKVIALRKIKVQRTAAMLAGLDEFIAAVRDTPFEQNRDELQAAVMRDRTLEEDWSSMFCAEVAAEALQQMGLVSEERHSNEYLPCDFSSENDTYGLVLCQGELLNEEIIRAPRAESDGAPSDPLLVA